MKKSILILTVAGGIGLLSWTISANLQATRDAALLAQRQSEWEKERQALQAEANKPAKLIREKINAPTPVEKRLSAGEIIEQIQKGEAGRTSGRNARLLIRQFEKLIEMGPTALPAIREYLTLNKDMNFDYAGAGLGKGAKVPSDFVVPPSLRFGLFDVARQIGDATAEKLLADMLGTTGRGLEVAYLARTLEEMAPGKYRALALTVAHDLLVNPPTAAPMDKYERDYLYGVLGMYNDTSLVAQAQNQIITADGQIDRSALKYVQKSLGEKSIPLAVQAYQDSRIDPAKKEPLARVGLYFAGPNDQANQLFDTAVRDPGLSVDTRRNYIEDLNQDGIANGKNPTPEDQKTIDARLKLIASYEGVVDDQILAGAFAEAKKDLLNMRAKYATTPAH